MKNGECIACSAFHAVVRNRYNKFREKNRRKFTEFPINYVYHILFWGKQCIHDIVKGHLMHN